jgi:hypothetical protein
MMKAFFLMKTSLKNESGEVDQLFCRIFPDFLTLSQPITGRSKIPSSFWRCPVKLGTAAGGRWRA